MGNTVFTMAEPHGVNRASDEDSSQHTEQDESLLSQRHLGSRHWWLKWSLPQGPCQPLTLVAYRQLDAPKNQTKKPAVGYGYYIFHKSMSSRIYDLNSIAVLTYEKTKQKANRSPTASPVLLHRDRVCFCWVSKHLFWKLGVFVSVCKKDDEMKVSLHFHCCLLYPITEQNIFKVTNEGGVTAKKVSYMSVFSVELGGMTSGSGLWSSGWQRSESRLEENKNEKQLQFCLSFFLLL